MTEDIAQWLNVEEERQSLETYSASAKDSFVAQVVADETTMYLNIYEKMVDGEAATNAELRFLFEHIRDMTNYAQHLEACCSSARKPQHY